MGVLIVSLVCVRRRRLMSRVNVFYISNTKDKGKQLQNHLFQKENVRKIVKKQQ